MELRIQRSLHFIDTGRCVHICLCERGITILALKILFSQYMTRMGHIKNTAEMGNIVNFRILQPIGRPSFILSITSFNQTSESIRIEQNFSQTLMEKKRNTK